MRRKIIAIVIIAIGACLVAYPIIGNIINVVRQNSVQKEYNSMVQKLETETKKQIKSDAEDYNKKLANGELNIISTDEDELPQDYDDGSGYSSALSVGSEVMAIIKIPKIDIELPIYRGTNALTLEKGIGHLRNTSLPVGGASSHCVLTGHTGLPSSALFTDINKLANGDMFYIQYLDEVHAYCVDQVKIVEPTDSSDLKIVPGKDYITLLTCYPYGINSHRLLVRGERVAFNGEITFGSDGKIKEIVEKPEDFIDDPSETDDSAIRISNGKSLLDELKNSKTKVNVYGVNVSLRLIIVILALVFSGIVAAIIIVVVNHYKKKGRHASLDDPRT